MLMNKTNYKDYKVFTNGVRFNKTHYAKVVQHHPKSNMKTVVDAPMFVGRKISNNLTNNTYTIKSVLRRFNINGGYYLTFIVEGDTHEEIFFSDIDTEDELFMRATSDFDKFYKIL